MSAATKPAKRPLRSLTAHEKLSAIRRVHDGESKASVARDIGVPESTLRGWCKNEEKISYLSRQSSPETDDSLDNPNKKPKLDDSLMQPYNLSLKTCGSSSGGTYSPNSNPDGHYGVDYTKNIESEVEKTPLNLRVKSEISLTTPKTTNVSDREKEREKNRAELARLSAELGLNRPEVFFSSLNNSNNMNDLTGLLIQWNSIYQQHLLYQQQKAQQNKNKVTAPADTSTKLVSPKGLLTTVDKEKSPTVLPNSEQPSVYDSVSYWLRQQSLMGITPNQSLTSTLPSTSSITPVTTTTAAANTTSMLNGMAANQHLKFWNWYKQSAYNPAPSVQQQGERPILYHQLTKDKDAQNTENVSVNEEKEKPKTNGSTNKSRSVLDNLLLNNNTIQYIKQEETEVLSQHEALEHGEKFLKWLEACSDPAVTTLQILTLQTLIKNLKSGADRKNGDLQNKAKVKRK